MDRVGIMAEHRGGVAAGRKAQRFGGDERVAVAVAADPAPDAQEARRTLPQLLFPARIEFGHYGQEDRSEEHTSELQSLMRISYAVFCLKKKNQSRITTQQSQHIEHHK